MGGKGSGRVPNIINMMNKQQFKGSGEEINLPNYAGILPEARNTNPNPILVSGSSHTLLSNIGTNTHATIDNAINALNDVTANRLLGRVSTDGTFQEISLGANLSFSGSTLVGAAGGVQNIYITEAETDGTSTSFANTETVVFSGSLTLSGSQRWIVCANVGVQKSNLTDQTLTIKLKNLTTASTLRTDTQGPGLTNGLTYNNAILVEDTGASAGSNLYNITCQASDTNNATAQAKALSLVQAS